MLSLKSKDDEANNESKATENTSTEGASTAMETDSATPEQSTNETENEELEKREKEEEVKVIPRLSSNQISSLIEYVLSLESLIGIQVITMFFEHCILIECLNLFWQVSISQPHPSLQRSRGTW